MNDFHKGRLSVHGGVFSAARSLRAWKFAEVCLWAVGVAALGYCGYVWSKGWIAQYRGSRDLDRSFSQGSRPASPPATGALLARLQIPRLEMSAVVFEGTDNDVLDLGVGHLQGSALPGDDGNVVLAAHRDTFFRSLRGIREHDVVTLSGPAGPRRYQVESLRIVSPFDTAVAGPTPQPTLTLITCYPFEFFGHAPQRFVVQAREIPAAASPVSLEAPPARRVAPPPQPKPAVVSRAVPAPPAPKLQTFAAPIPPPPAVVQPLPYVLEPLPQGEKIEGTVAAEQKQPKHRRGWNPIRWIKKIGR